MKSLKSSNPKRLNVSLTCDLLFAVILILYPMRHINWGLDFWDTGYNYANFTYMGLEHMDPMWLFSTYLANVVGHFLTLLPGAGGLVGMNFYTGLFVSALAAGGYFFCTRSLKIPRWIAFVGEMAAVSLCWCPTSLLYNYMTYALFTGCVMLLYKGLTEEKSRLLFAAGVCLGCNVLVRFSNLPEAAMIVAVWAWDFIVWWERRGQNGRCGQNNRCGQDGRDAKEKKKLPAAIRHTLWCLGGYLAALTVLLGYISIRYGWSNYMEGIRRLFAMTENATDYTAKSMIMGMIGTYVENLYWVVRLCAIAVVGVIGFSLVGWIFAGAGDGTKRMVGRACKIGWCGVVLLIPVWLYFHSFYSLLFYTYGPMDRSAVLFLLLTMCIGVFRVLHPGSPKEEKLISGMMVLVVLLTSLGSNNRVYPSINHLFIAAPYTLWECWRFMQIGKDWRFVKLFPAKAVLTVFLGMFLVLSAGFGACFVFAEGTGEQNITAVVENNKILNHVKMNPERAKNLSGLNTYVNENGLQGREVILFGQIPSLSYYLQMPAAFNPWSDLRSYSYETMRDSMEAVTKKLETGSGERPVLILDREYVRDYEDYPESGAAGLRERGIDENRIVWIAETERKYRLIKDFAERFNYDLTYQNDKFLVYE